MGTKEGSTLDLSANRRKDAVEIPENLPIRKPNDPQTTLLEDRRSSSIILLPSIVEWAIHFDHQPACMTIEVCNETT